MSKLLNAIIDLNNHILNNDLENTKNDVATINENLDELTELAGKESFAMDIADYFGIYDNIANHPNEASLYAVNNLQHCDELKKEVFHYIILVNEAISDRNIGRCQELIEDILTKHENLNVFLLNIIMQLINYTKKYEYLEKIINKGGDS